MLAVACRALLNGLESSDNGQHLTERQRREIFNTSADEMHRLIPVARVRSANVLKHGMKFLVRQCAVIVNAQINRCFVAANVAWFLRYTVSFHKSNKCFGVLLNSFLHTANGVVYSAQRPRLDIASFFFVHVWFLERAKD